MSERVARGLPVRPLPRHRKRAAVAKFGKSAVSLLSPNASSLSLDASYNNEGSENNHEQDDENERRDWVRDAVKAVDTSKSWVKDGVNLVKDIRVGTSAPPSACLSLKYQT